MKNKITEYRNKLNDACQKKDFTEILKIALAILNIMPDDYQALLNIAKVYVVGAEEEKAITVFNKLIRLYGDKDWETMYYLARAKFQNLESLGDVKPVKKLWQIPNLTKQQKLDIYDLLNRHYLLTGEIGLNIKCCKKILHYCEDKERKCKEYTNYLFNLHYLYNIRPEHLYNEHKKYNDFFNNVKTYEHNKNIRKKKLRIAYISPDFHRHAVVLFVYHMLNKYDKKYFEVYCYAKCEEDEISRQIKQFVDGWVNIKDMSDENIAQKIYNDNIDILFDLSGHTKGNSLAVLARKPAPVQICGIGYFDTTGLKAIDYFLTDVFCDDFDENNECFTEKLLRLPHSHFGYTAVETNYNPQAAPCMKNNYITFGSMNFFSKINSVVAKTWQKILDKVPNSRILLKDRTVTTPMALAKVKKRWEKAGLDIGRLEFSAWSPDYLKSYQEIDIALDSFPYPGGATTCDALYMGVPVITLKGQRHGARFGYSLLKNIGSMDDCIAFSIEDYINKAVILANNYNRINYMHLTLRERMKMSPVMNGYLYMQNLEKMYLNIWENYSGQKLIQNTADKIRSAEIYRQSMQYQEAYSILTDVINNNETKNKSAIYETMAQCCIKLGRPQQAAMHYLQAGINTNNENRIKNYSNYLLSILYYEHNIKKIIDEHNTYGQFFSHVQKLPLKQEQNGKIKIAYISADFRQHVMFYFYQAMFNDYDKNKFEIIGYCLNAEDTYTHIIKNQFDKWFNVKNKDWPSIAKQIHQEKIDILVDLSGHSSGNALPVLAYRPANIQISALGYIGPIGLSDDNYYLTDKYISTDSNIKEKIINITSQFCYYRDDHLPAVLTAPCIKNKYITFASFNNYAKITDEMLITWYEILQKVPQSILLLKTQSFISIDVRKAFSDRLKKLKINTNSIYLECADALYMQRYMDVDIALDTFPYNGGGTTCDALYMGVPVITLCGESYTSRIGNSILKNMNLNELITESNGEYINTAVKLAHSPEVLAVLHKNLRQMMISSPIMDSKRYIKELENIYLQLIEDRKKNENY